MSSLSNNISTDPSFFKRLFSFRHVLPKCIQLSKHLPNYDASRRYYNLRCRRHYSVLVLRLIKEFILCFSSLLRLLQNYLNSARMVNSVRSSTLQIALNAVLMIDISDQQEWQILIPHLKRSKNGRLKLCVPILGGDITARPSEYETYDCCWVDDQVGSYAFFQR